MNVFNPHLIISSNIYLSQCTNYTIKWNFSLNYFSTCHLILCDPTSNTTILLDTMFVVCLDNDFILIDPL